MKTKEAEKQEITYEEIEKAFKEEAGSFIAEEVVVKTLAQERKKFLCAMELGVSPAQFTGNGVSRYTKGLLRREQPFCFLYEFLGFMMELSVILFLYLVLYGAVMTAMTSKNLFMTEKEFLYAVVLVGCYLVFMRVKAARVGKFLVKCYDIAGNAVDEEEKDDLENVVREKIRFGKDRQRLQNRVKRLFVFPAVVLTVFGICCCFFLWRQGISAEVKMDPIAAFLIYIAFALLSGVHNVIYSSFFVPYCMVGGSILMRKSKEETDVLVTRYKMLCYERMVSYRGKTMEDFLREEALAGELMQKLRGRMAVYRGGTFFGMFILLVLSVVCVIQMILLQLHVSATFYIFTFFVIVGTVLFCVAFFSANRVWKTLPK